MTEVRAGSARQRPIRRGLLRPGALVILVAASLALVPRVDGPGHASPIVRAHSSDAARVPGGPSSVNARLHGAAGGFVTLAPTGRAGTAGQAPLPTSPEPVIESPAAHPQAGVEESGHRLAAVVTPAQSSTRFAFQNSDPATGQPVTWSPCRPIHFVINAAGAPPGFTAAVLRAADEAAVGSGLRLVYDGATSERLASPRADFQPDRYGARWAPVLVGTMTPESAGVSEVTAGLTSLVRVSSATQPDPHYVTGQIALFEAAFSGVLPDGTSLLDQVLRHEFGHLLGLGHTPALGQVMDSPNTGVGRLQAGDLTGLSQLGQGTCAPGI